MSIDYTALLGLGAGIQVGKADYDFTRDGGAVGIHGANSQVVPDGSIIVAVAIYTTIGFTFSGSGAVRVLAGDAYIYTADPVLGRIVATWFNTSAALVTTADRPVVFEVYTNACTAGACTAWVFYLPT